MFTPFATALVFGNCIAGVCLVGSVALVCGAGSLKNFSDAGLEGGGDATNSFFRFGLGSWPTF